MSIQKLLLAHEVKSAFGSRWFVTYAATFVISGLMLTTLGLSDPVVHGYRGFARAFAGMVHLALFVVPLLALIPTAVLISENRENGVLEYTLAQPVTPRQVYLSKWLGSSLGLLMVVLIGFGVAAASALLRGVPVGLVSALFGFILLLTLCFGALGVALSSVSGTRAQSLTLAVVSWLALTSLGSLGVMFLAIKVGVPRLVLEAWTFVNPVEAFRLGVLAILDPDLGLLGPVGAHLIEALGPSGVVAFSGLSLIGWTLVAGLLGMLLFRR